MTRGTTRAEDSNPPGEYYCPTCEKHYAIGDKCPLDNTRLVKLAVAIDPFIGRELDGRYTVVEKLGQGGMGAVYRAQQHGLGREVAIKVVNSSLVQEAEVIKRFLREAKLASRLSHPNAVGVIESGQTPDGVFYLVMELVQGRTLDVIIKAEKVLPPARVVRIGSQVCDALDGAHALSIVHRDLKPSNIMLLSQGRDLVKVLDFGLAKSVAPDQTSTTMTNAGVLLGTPAFIPPELALGEACDGRADLYSLGCVLYLLASGKLPYVSDSAHELIALHAGDDRPPPLTGIPPALAAVIEKLLEKNPADRYQSAAETREALENAMAVTPPHGISLAKDTIPSIGPFPVSSADLKATVPERPKLPTGRTTAVGKRPRSETEMERLIGGDTMAAVNDTMIHKPSAAVEAPARRKWLVPAILGGMVAVGGIAFGVAKMSGSSHDAPAPSVAPMPAAQPAATPPAPMPSPAPTPAPTPVPDPTPPPAPPTHVSSPPPAPPPVDKHGTATVKKTQPKPPPTETQKTEPPKPEPPKPPAPKAGSGSTAPKTGLPF